MCTSHREWLFHPRQPDMQCPQWDLWFRTDPPEQPAHVICSRRRLRPAALLTPAVCGSIRATGAFTASPLMRTIEYSLGQWGTIWFHQHRNGPCEVCLGKGLCSSCDNGKYWGGRTTILVGHLPQPSVDFFWSELQTVQLYCEDKDTKDIFSFLPIVDLTVALILTGQSKPTQRVGFEQPILEAMDGCAAPVGRAVRMTSYLTSASASFVPL